MKINKNIVFLIPGFPENEEDVNCIPSLQNYILYYHKLNPATKISVISFQYPFRRKKYIWNNITIYAIGGKNKRGVFKILTWSKVFLCFLKIHLKTRITTIHSFWLTECAFIGQILAKLFMVKHIATIAGQDSLPSNKYLKYLNFSKITVVALSRFGAEKFKSSTYKEVQEVISIGLDIENFAKPISRLPPIDILGVGNLYALKNYRLFVEVVTELLPEFPNLKCMIIGDGVEYNMLKEMILEKGLSEHIVLKGMLLRNQVIELMAKSKIFLHPSNHEGQGYVFAEALYSGMAVVAHKVGNLVEGEKVALCNNKKEMIEHLTRFLNTETDRKRILIQDMEDTISKYNLLYFSKIYN